MMSIIWIVLQLLIGYNLVLPVVLYFLTIFVRPRRRVNSIKPSSYDFAVIVTAYEQTHLLQATIDSILRVNYDRFHIYVVADNCDLSTIKILHPSVSIFRPESVLANNVKSHFYAIDRFIRNHDILTIIDSDNIVHSEYLNEVSALFSQGFHAVQGVRKPKKLMTTIACLDAARDLYYNFYDGKVMFKLGSSATLAGSGMAFTTKLYKSCLQNLEIDGAGFDKVLQAQLISRNYRIAYAPKAIVYDEKTARPNQLVSQRSRWIATWFKYVGHGGRILVKGVKNRSVNQLLFGIVIIRPPLFFFILASIVSLGVSFFVNPFHAIVWMGALSLFVIAFFLALTKQDTSKEIYKSLVAIPAFIYYQLVSLYYSRTKTKVTVATKHE